MAKTQEKQLVMENMELYDIKVDYESLERTLKHQKLREIYEEFNAKNILDEKLKFDVYTENMACYSLYLENGTSYEINVINQNMDFFDRMTIELLLEKEPFYFDCRCRSGVGGIIFKKTFRILDVKINN